jgi:hypothetical protein
VPSARFATTHARRFKHLGPQRASTTDVAVAISEGVHRMSLSSVIGAQALALLEEAIVALPRGDALERLPRLRSPAWAGSLPGAIIVGTFGVRAVSPVASRPRR